MTPYTPCSILSYQQQRANCPVQCNLNCSVSVCAAVTLPTARLINRPRQSPRKTASPAAAVCLFPADRGARAACTVRSLAVSKSYRSTRGSEYGRDYGGVRGLLCGCATDLDDEVLNQLLTSGAVGKRCEEVAVSDRALCTRRYPSTPSAVFRGYQSARSHSRVLRAPHIPSVRLRYE